MCLYVNVSCRWVYNEHGGLFPPPFSLSGTKVRERVMSGTKVCERDVILYTFRVCCWKTLCCTVLHLCCTVSVTCRFSCTVCVCGIQRNLWHTIEDVKLCLCNMYRMCLWYFHCLYNMYRMCLWHTMEFVAYNGGCTFMFVQYVSYVFVVPYVFVPYVPYVFVAYNGVCGIQWSVPLCVYNMYRMCVRYPMCSYNVQYVPYVYRVYRKCLWHLNADVPLCLYEYVSYVFVVPYVFVQCVPYVFVAYNGVCGVHGRICTVYVGDIQCHRRHRAAPSSFSTTKWMIFCTTHSRDSSIMSL